MVSFYTLFEFFTLCQNFASKFICFVRSLWDLSQSGIFLNPRHSQFRYNSVLKLQMTIHNSKNKKPNQTCNLSFLWPLKRSFQMCIKLPIWTIFVLSNCTLDAWDNWYSKTFWMFLSQSIKGFDNLGCVFILGTQAHLVVVFFKISPMV
jgi:hypothetical protein